MPVPVAHAGTAPDGPEEGQYDVRRGAAGYAPLASTFGALTLPALVLVFTTTSRASPHELALCTGLLVIGLFGSLLGAFGLAAIGAERDPTANLAPASMFSAIPVAASIFATLGAFQVLATVYAPKSTNLFLVIVGAGTIYGILLTALIIGDAPSLHPRTLSTDDLAQWRASQWLKDRRSAYRATNQIVIVCLVPPVITLIARLYGHQFALTTTLINNLIYFGLGACLFGAGFSAWRTKHPESGNHQMGVRPWEAWVTTLVVALFSSFVLALLPTGR